MYKIIDLFCGIGGFSYGFEMTNRFMTVLGLDFWDVALKTFKRNHKGTKVEFADIGKLANEFWEKYNGDIDLLLAGPPCQGFSMSGKRDILDERNNLFKEVVRVATIVKPKIIVIENVVGLLSMKDADGELIKNIIIKDFRELGYYIDYDVLTASNYGVPQNRKRVIFIASLLDNIRFPKKTHGKNLKPVVTVRDALSNILNDSETYAKPDSEFQELMSGRKDILNHEKINHAPHIVERMRSVPQGGNWQDIPIELGQGGGKHSNNYKRLDNNLPAITIKHVSKSMIIHPLYDRSPTVREVARLQSFDDDFEMLGTKYNQYQQLANAVPPLLGKAIAETILRMLGDYND